MNKKNLIVVSVLFSLSSLRNLCVSAPQRYLFLILA